MIRYLLFRLLDRRAGVFRFHDGRRWRAVDPFTAYRALLLHETFNPDADLSQIRAESENPREKLYEATMRGDRAARDVFGVPAFEKGGLATAECVVLLADFYEFVTGQKKSGNPPQTSPPATESVPSAEDSPAKLDSGFT